MLSCRTNRRDDPVIFRRRHLGGEAAKSPDDAPFDLDARELAGMFAPPTWLRDLGILAWILVGVGVLLFGVIWLLGLVSTIVMPVLSATIVASVAGPAVSSQQRRGLPRVVGAGLVLLLVLALAAVVALLVIGGIVSQGDEIRSAASDALDKVESWANDAGADGTSGPKEDVETAVPAIAETLLRGVADGIEGLTSIAFFLSLAVFSLFFLLKDGPTVRRFVDRHLGVPVEVARTVTGNTLSSLRRYFLGVSIVAAFNGVVVGLGALVLGVPLAGTIAVVTFVTAYVPFIGAVVSGAFAVILTLSAEGTSDAAIMLVIVLLANGLLQNVLQPVAFGATLGLNPLVVLIVTIAAGCLFGMVGLVLAAPLTSAAVRISGDLARAGAAQRDASASRGPPTPSPAAP
jgi:putative heme transporter